MNRFEVFKADACNCIDSFLLLDSPHYEFSEFTFNVEGNALQFKWTSLSTNNFCILNYIASEDYPDNCFLHCHWNKTGKQDSSGCSLPLTELLKKLGKDLLAQDQAMEGKDQLPDDADTKDSSAMDRFLLALSGNNQASSEDSDGEYLDCESAMDPPEEEDETNVCASDDDNDECYDFDPADLFAEEDSTEDALDMEEQSLRSLHPLLRHDIQKFRELEPSEAAKVRKRMAEGGKYSDTDSVIPLLSLRFLEALEELDCDIHVPLDNLDLSPQLAQAWGLNLKEPLVLRVNLSSQMYLNVPDPPKVEVFQQKKKDCGVAPQLKNIVKLFLGEIWPKLNNDFLDSKLKKSGSMPCDLSGAAGDIGKTKRKPPILSRLKRLFTIGRECRKRAVAGDGVSLSALQRLQEMGFGETQSRSALLLTNNNLMDASMMLANMASSDDVEKDSLPASQNTPDVAPQQGTSKKKPKSKKLSQRHLSTPVTTRSKKAESVARSMSTSHTEPNISEASENPIVIESSVFLHAKQMPSLENGFLVMLYRYILQRVPTINEFCVVCDRPHVFHASGAMLMPSVCSRELCLFAFQTLGVMADTTAEIATGADVVDLLITMAKAACFSQRKVTIFSPFPNIVDPANPVPGKLAISEKSKDFKKVEGLLSQLPAMKALLGTSCNDLQKTLDGRDKLLYPLLSWIIYSNRSHIVKLPKEKQLHIMATPHQFILLSSPPAQEKVFQEAKEEFGSCFAFHGSGIENWHSIIRQGLIVATGTRYQVNGAAYGKGIYLSPTASMSAGYAGMGVGFHKIPSASQKGQLKTGSPSRFLQGKEISCMALCEVINSPYLKKHSQGIWVCTNESHVCTRFFFVYEWGQVNSSEVSMNNPKHVDMVEKALDECFMAVVPKLSRKDKAKPSEETQSTA